MSTDALLIVVGVGQLVVGFCVGWRMRELTAHRRVMRDGGFHASVRRLLEDEEAGGRLLDTPVTIVDGPHCDFCKLEINPGTRHERYSTNLCSIVDDLTANAAPGDGGNGGSETVG